LVFYLKPLVSWIFNGMDASLFPGRKGASPLLLRLSHRKNRDARHGEGGKEERITVMDMVGRGEVR